MNNAALQVVRNEVPELQTTREMQSDSKAMEKMPLTSRVENIE
jgi:hypothetical protein